MQKCCIPYIPCRSLLLSTIVLNENQCTYITYTYLVSNLCMCCMYYHHFFIHSSICGWKIKHDKCSNIVRSTQVKSTLKQHASYTLYKQVTWQSPRPLARYLEGNLRVIRKQLARNSHEHACKLYLVGELYHIF